MATAAQPQPQVDPTPVRSAQFSHPAIINATAAIELFRGPFVIAVICSNRSSHNPQYIGPFPCTKIGNREIIRSGCLYRERGRVRNGGRQTRGKRGVQLDNYELEPVSCLFMDAMNSIINASAR